MVRRLTAAFSIVGVLLAGSFATTGCIGRMALSGKVLQFNLNATQEKWPREILFLCLYIIPVYPLSGMIDLLILNAIEFWSGKNPLTGEKALVLTGWRKEYETADGGKTVQTGREDGSIVIEHTAPDGSHEKVTLRMEGDRVVAFGEDGAWLGEVSRDGELRLDPQVRDAGAARVAASQLR